MLDSERCRTCKHWDTEWDQVDRPMLYSTEPNTKDQPLPGEWGDCQRIIHRKSDYIGHDWQPGPNDLAFLSDGSGYFASITTRAEFGCALWEDASAR